MIFQAWCFQKYWSAIARDSSMNWFKVEKKGKKCFRTSINKLKCHYFHHFQFTKFTVTLADKHETVGRNDKIYNSFLGVTNRRQGDNQGSIVICIKKQTKLWVGHFVTISGHFLVNCINIFHKIELQTIILMCLTCLNLIWIKSYNIKHNLCHFL